MEFDAIIAMVLGAFPKLSAVFAAIGLLVVFAEAVVALTPSTKDDEAWEKIKALPIVGPLLAAIAKLAPIQKK